MNKRQDNQGLFRTDTILFEDPFLDYEGVDVAVDVIKAMVAFFYYQDMSYWALYQMLAPKSFIIAFLFFLVLSFKLVISRFTKGLKVETVSLTDYGNFFVNFSLSCLSSSTAPIDVYSPLPLLVLGVISSSSSPGGPFFY